jgi:4-aminobutyrate aminotransferase-like enzyme
VCRERGVLLIVDEIQTGLGRCGTTWACDLYDVQPDILVVGKALGGGFPIGAFITRNGLIPAGLESEPWHMLTFMNQPLAAAAGIAVLDIIDKEKLVERARTLGSQFTEYFTQLARRYDVIGDIRGPGLFVGVDFVEDQATKAPATNACRRAWEFAIDSGLITQFGGFAANVYKFKPPLTTPKEDFESMLAISEKMVHFIQAEVDRQRKGRSVQVPATVGD